MQSHYYKPVLPNQLRLNVSLYSHMFEQYRVCITDPYCPIRLECTGPYTPTCLSNTESVLRIHIVIWSPYYRPILPNQVGAYGIFEWQVTSKNFWVTSVKQDICRFSTIENQTINVGNTKEITFSEELKLVRESGDMRIKNCKIPSLDILLLLRKELGWLGFSLGWQGCSLDPPLSLRIYHYKKIISPAWQIKSQYSETFCASSICASFKP